VNEMTDLTQAPQQSESGDQARRNGQADTDTRVAEASAQYLVQAAHNASPVSHDCPPGYKRTEVGVIPEDWRCITLGEIGDVVRGGSPRPAGDPKFFNGDYIPWLTVASLTNIPSSDIYVTGTVSKLTRLGSLQSRTLEQGTLIISNSGATLGIAKVLGIKCCANDGVAAIINQTDGVCEFLVQYINTQTKKLHDKVATGNGQPNLNTDLIRNIFVPFPCEKEQTAIANALSDVDALISELEKLIAKKQAIKTATMQQLLTGRTRLPQFALREDGTPKGYKQSELGEIPEDWEVVKLGCLAKFFKGSGLPKSELSESGKVKCIHYGQLFTTYGPKIERVISRTKRDGVVTSQENDVLMPTSDVTPNGLATASCITEPGVTLGGDILIIRADKRRLNGVFFSYLVNVLRDQVMQLVTGSTVYHLYGSDMSKFEFALPPSEEQTAIATILSDMDEEIQALQQRLAKTRQIKQGMMQELLTGKTRLVKPE